jgi:hypothetical protein
LVERAKRELAVVGGARCTSDDASGKEIEQHRCVFRTDLTADSGATWAPIPA